MSRLLKSSKFWAAVVALCVVIAVQSFGIAEESADQISVAVMILISAVIGGTAIEDAATKLRIK